MDSTKRQITKIAREASRFTGKVLKDTGIGPAEYEFIHCVRHNPGISQQRIHEKLGQDKAAIARRAVNLEKKGYIIRKPDPNDGRGKMLFATEKSDTVKDSIALVEAFFYQWLLCDIKGREREVFLKVLDRVYWKSKNERRENFVNLIALEAAQHDKSKT